MILQHETDQRFETVFNALESGDRKPKQGIFYDGQVFDAYVFVSDLIRSAKQSIVLVDNYMRNGRLVSTSTYILECYFKRHIDK